MELRHRMAVCAVALLLAVWFAATQTGQPAADYGKDLAIARSLGVGPTMAVAVEGNRAFIIGRGKLHVADIGVPAEPKIVGSLAGLGNTRQIKLCNGIGYVTSREDGVFIVDVREPGKPALLCHYDAIEVATGIDVAGEVMFVACRLHGVELVDVSNPRKPRHLSTTRTGEAQSVCVRNGFAYVGVWGTLELVVVDVRNPREPKIVARCPLDGYGDGVAVRGNYCFVATGHHSRAPRAVESDPGFGRGHGLEIFDITNPAKPVFISRVKLPRFYALGNDMWGVKVAGNHAFVADTYNGIFVVDISEPRTPRVVARRQLPRVARSGLPGFVGGLALAKDCIYVAGGDSDLHVVSAPGLATPCQPEPSTPLMVPVLPVGKTNDRFRVYQSDGQVRAIDFLDDIAVVAAGCDGVHLVQLWPNMKRLGRFETQGVAMDVRVRGDLVYVAEDKGGLSIWRRSGEAALTPAGRYQPKGQTVREVFVPPPGKYALLQVGLSVLEILDVSDPSQPKRVFSDKGHGFLYQMAGELVAHRYACAVWQIDGLLWYDLAGPTPALTGDKYPYRHGHGVGVIGDKALLLCRDGPLLLARNEQRPPAELKARYGDKRPLLGRAWIYGNTMYVANRATGEISVLDVSEATEPKLKERYTVPGNPGRIVVHKGAVIIPNGYDGLWVDGRASR